MKYPNIYVFILFILAVVNNAAAQEVGLVLSGGGAKGLAHIGVLKALEEENIPIDYLAGTSMGGVIAGCYAAGYSAEEIEEMVLSEDFLRWVNGELEPGYNYFYHQEDPMPSVFDAVFSIDSTFNATFQSSIASDLSLNFALVEQFAQASQIARYNFDSLFVPVRIIAADVFTQQEVVLDSGSLGAAVRTSLSVPFFYKPIRISRKYLFDGGIYNNFPVDVMQAEFAPEVIIGVNVASKVYEEYPYEEDEELLNNSMLFMMLDKSDPSEIPASGIYLEPDLTGYTAFDFEKVESLIDSGYVHTKRHIQEIRAKTKQTAAGRDAARRAFREKAVALNFTGIDFQGFSNNQQKYINRLFGFEAGENLSFEEVKKGYFELVSEPYFSSIYPGIYYDSSDYRLVLNSRPQRNLRIGLGGVIASRHISQVYLGLQHYYFNNYLLRTGVNLFAGNFYKSAQVKTRLMLSGKFPVFIEPEFMYNSMNYINSDDLFIDEKRATVLETIERKYGLNMGFPFNVDYRGVIHGSVFNNENRYAAPENLVPSDTLDHLQLKGLQAGVRFERNTLNRKQYPNDGLALTISLDYYAVRENFIPGSTSDTPEFNDVRHHFVRLKAHIEHYLKNGNFSTGYVAEGVLSNQPMFGDVYGSIINAPAFEPLNDSRTLLLQNFVGFNYLAGGLRNIYSFTDNLELRLEGYAFKALDGFRSEQDQLPKSMQLDRGVKFAASAGMVLHSPLGPVNLSVNYYDDEENQVGVLLHVGYLLFNRRAWD